jgi:hypothetical protein
MYPSDLLSSVMGDDILKEMLQSKSGFQKAVELEMGLREDETLLGSGSEVQFVAVDKGHSAGGRARWSRLRHRC